jgi:hypothetical protein
MAGLARTDKMLLSTATVMLGAVADLHKLNTIDHSIGLVKNVSLSLDPQYVELGQGLTNDIVMSVKNADGVRVSMEAYEFTLRNLAYGAGLDGSGAGFDTIALDHVAKTAPTTTSVKINGDVTANYATGDFIYIQKGESDAVHIAKLTTVAFATSETTLTVAAGFEIPAAYGFGIGARIGKVKKITVGGSTSQPELSAKIVGLLPKTNQPLTILLPKVKVTRGLAVSFSNENFSNMPFELTPYAGLPSDPFYNEYGAGKMHLFPR